VKWRQGATDSMWSLLCTRVERGVPRTAAKSLRSSVIEYTYARARAGKKTW
jgi:hypothetical protein